jgi:hypothetical protein
VSPKTGLLLGDYIDTVTVRYYDRELAKLEVKFSVTKRPPPAADIDYINELLISLLDGQYSFNYANPVTVRGAVGWPIPDAWMTDDDLINEQIDATGHASFPQLLLIPQRPAAPANLTVRPSNFGWDDGEIYGLNDSMEYKLETADEWTLVPVGAISLVDLPPGMYLVRYKAIYNEAFSSVIAPMRVSDWVLPDITREVHLPEAAGTTVQPSPGVHYVRSSNDFAFILQFSGTPLMVRTNRYTDGVQEELTGIPDAFGGYVYTIRRVTEQIYVYIGPETVGNLAVDGVSLWAYRGMIHIETLHEETADIYTIAGRLVQRVKAPEGVTSVSVAPGVYIVVLKSGRTGKVIVN